MSNWLPQDPLSAASDRSLMPSFRNDMDLLRSQCVVSDCERKQHGHGYCQTHLQLLRRHGDPSLPAKRSRSTTGLCTIPECGGKHCSRGLCRKHWDRLRRNGDPMVLARAVSTSGVSPAVKKQFVIEYKLSRGCADCGFCEHPAALDFDHRPGTSKVRDIKSGQQLGWQALLDEIAKCDVVCANCHRIRTFERAQAR